MTESKLVVVMQYVWVPVEIYWMDISMLKKTITVKLQIQPMALTSHVLDGILQSIHLCNVEIKCAYESQRTCNCEL